MRAWSRGEASPGETAGLDEQGLDRGLLLRLYDRLADRIVIDVGAERGAFVEAFLDACCARVYAVEPYPANIRRLRKRFAGDDRVRVLGVALGPGDETRELHITEDRSGREYAYYHSLVAFPDTPEVRWGKQVPVTCRSLGSLVEDGTLPAEVGILKVATEGYDLEVVRGMGRLSAAVVMVEYWDSLPATFTGRLGLAGLRVMTRPAVRSLVSTIHPLSSPLFSSPLAGTLVKTASRVRAPRGRAIVPGCSRRRRRCSRPGRTCGR